ncbi:MAG: hypothetical protein WBD55_08345 [Dehalococcoidia bacterium]
MGGWSREDWEKTEEVADEDEDDLEGDWELDPNDPTHPDFDLSESAGYSDWEPSAKPVLLWRGVVVLLTLLLILALTVPLLMRFGG